MKKITIYSCENIGVSGTTPCHLVQLNDNKYEARMGFALMGATNMTEEQFKRVDYDPFHPEFYDNYAVGIGATEEEAIENMKEFLCEVGESLWA